MPIITDETINSMKYFNWYMIRYFASFPQLAQFIVDNREELGNLKEKYNLTWYNIVFGLGSILLLGEIFCVDTKQPISLESIHNALREHLERYYEENSKYENEEYDEEYNEDDEEWEEEYESNIERGPHVDSMYFDDAFLVYFKKPKLEPSTLRSMYEWTTDTINGRFIKKDSIIIMKSLHQYFKLLCTQ